MAVLVSVRNHLKLKIAFFVLYSFMHFCVFWNNYLVIYEFYFSYNNICVTEAHFFWSLAIKLENDSYYLQEL